MYDNNYERRTYLLNTTYLSKLVIFYFQNIFGLQNQIFRNIYTFIKCNSLKLL